MWIVFSINSTRCSRHRRCTEPAGRPSTKRATRIELIDVSCHFPGSKRRSTRAARLETSNDRGGMTQIVERPVSIAEADRQGPERGDGTP